MCEEPYLHHLVFLILILQLLHNSDIWQCVEVCERVWLEGHNIRIVKYLCMCVCVCVCV